MYHWRTKWLALNPPLENEAQPAPSFIPIKKEVVEPELKATEPDKVYEVVYPNGVSLRLPSLDLSILKQLIDLHV